VVEAPKFSHSTPILRSFHWLKIDERIEYKLLSLTYKVLTTSQPDYLHNRISVQSSGRTRSSSAVTLARPSVSSSPTTLLDMHHLTCGISSLLHSVNLILFNLLPFTSCTHHLITIPHWAFRSRLKAHLFHKSFPGGIFQGCLYLEQNWDWTLSLSLSRVSFLNIMFWSRQVVD